MYAKLTLICFICLASILKKEFIENVYRMYSLRVETTDAVRDTSLNSNIF